MPGRAAVAPQRATALLTLTAGVALAEAVTALTGLPPAIKWPNDLLVGRRKLAGILAEATATPCGSGVAAEHDRLRVVLGFGINVRQAAYPPELAARVTSLETELGRIIDRAALCAESLAALARRYEDLMTGRFDAILDEWRRRAPGSRGARVHWETGSGAATGITAGIDESGALLVQTGDTVERLVAGEVLWD
jgi:BirA family biotin operon repressor/biotin-[acetyl-CoA-carboxylase] ligase